MEKIKVKNCVHCPYLIPSIFACVYGKYATAIWNPFKKREDCPFREEDKDGDKNDDGD